MIEDSDVEFAHQTLVSIARVGLLDILTGDSSTSLIGDGEQMSVEDLVELLRLSPPVVDPSVDEVTKACAFRVDQDTGECSISLFGADGSEVVIIKLRWRLEPETIPDLPSFELHLASAERAPGVAPSPHRRPDREGRLPAEQFIGSPSLRMKRLFAALPNALEAPADGRWNDRMSATWLIWADDDIYNGSLHQFYSNSTGDFARVFPEFAHRVGAIEKAAAISTANEVFGEGDLDDWAQRNAKLEHMSSEERQALDLASDAYIDADEDVTALLVQYVEASPAEFLIPAE